MTAMLRALLAGAATLALAGCAGQASVHPPLFPATTTATTATCNPAADCNEAGTPPAPAPTSDTAHAPTTHEWRVAQTQQELSGGILQSVACATATVCFAVGGGETSGIIDQLSAGKWTNIDNETEYLYGVTCPSVSSCWAVGTKDALGSSNDSANSPGAVSVIKHWNGDQWGDVQAPPGPKSISQLSSVDCASVSNCWAAGYSNDGATDESDDVGYTYHYNGSNWIAAALPDAGSGSGWDLNLVSCRATDECWMAGSFKVSSSGGVYSFPINLRLVNGSWQVITGPSNVATSELGGPVTTTLFGIGCASANKCVGVGAYTREPGASGTALAAQDWDGTSWSNNSSVPSLGDQDGTGEGAFYGMICASASSCWAAGEVPGSGGSVAGFASFNGDTWTVENPPPPATPFSAGDSAIDWLNSVACPNQNDCWAVGTTTTAHEPLIEHMGS